MKKILFVFAIAALGFTACEPDNEGSEDVSLLTAETMPDGAFRFVILRAYDMNDDGIIDRDEANAIDSIDCSGMHISTLKGVELFPNLTYLDCSGNQLTSLDVSKNTALTYLSCGGNDCMTSLNVSGHTSLTTLVCQNSQLTNLDVSGCTALEDLDCDESQLTSLDVSSCTALKNLSCFSNQLTALDVSDCTALDELVCSYNQLTALDVSGCTALRYLTCDDNQLTSIDVSKNTALKTLSCSGNAYHVTAAMLNMFDLNQLPEGFDISKAIDWNGGTVEGTALTFAQPEVTYTYNTGYMGEDDRYKTVTFTLVCDNYDESLK